jgi:hypothetical protein
LHIEFKDATGDDVAKDHEVDMVVGFSPGTEVRAPVASNFDAAVKGIEGALLELAPLDTADTQHEIPGWMEKYGFKTLTVQLTGDDWEIDGEMSPKRRVATPKIPGTRRNPFLLDWPKPASAAYPTLYFGGRIDRPRAQSILSQRVGQPDETGIEVRAYSPHRGGQLAEGAHIGIAEPYRVAVGSIVGPLSTATTPGGGKVLDALAPYGFVASKEGLDGDHVREIQFGGVDVLGNLWPLDAGTNRGAGSILSSATVEYPTSGKLVPIADLKQNTRSYFFKITKTR